MVETSISFADKTVEELQALKLKYSAICKSSTNEEARQKFVKTLEAVFDENDKDKNGEIDREEFEALITGFFKNHGIDTVKENYDVYFTKIDSNGDARISLEEFKAWSDNILETENMPALEAEIVKRGI